MALIVIVAGVAGYLLGSLREHVEPTAPVAQPAAVQDTREPEWAAAILMELAALREEMRQAKATPASRTPVAAGVAPEPGPDVDIARLNAAIARLEARPKLSTQAVRSPPEPQLLERLGREASTLVWDDFEGFTDRTRYDAWETRVREELTRSHQLWTLEDVLQVYGPPSNISTQTAGIQTLSYAFRSLDEQTSLLLQFWFEGDRVVSVQPDTGSPH